MDRSKMVQRRGRVPFFIDYIRFILNIIYRLI